MTTRKPYTPEQKERYRLARLAKLGKAPPSAEPRLGGERVDPTGPTVAEQIAAEAVGSEPHYGPAHGRARTVDWCRRIARQIERELDQVHPGEPTMGDVASAASARVHLEKALLHLQASRAGREALCIWCPAKERTRARPAPVEAQEVPIEEDPLYA